MWVDYNDFAKDFASSRKNMKWPELQYFFSMLNSWSILDIWCWSGRFLESFKDTFWFLPENYQWMDMSSELIKEASNTFPDFEFHIWNMLNLDGFIKNTYLENVFLIASFHHLDNLIDRENMMNILYAHTQVNWKVYMTNWALESSINKNKYQASKIEDSENQFWSSDFNIKFWEFDRYYHSFSLDELKYLSEKAGFKILENRLFHGDKNIVTILQK